MLCKLTSSKTRDRLIQPLWKVGPENRVIPLLTGCFEALCGSVSDQSLTDRWQSHRHNLAGSFSSPAFPQDLHSLCPSFVNAHQRPVAQGHPELLSSHTGGNSEGALSGVHPHAEPAKHPVAKDAPVCNGAAPKQRFANKYNRHQFPLGKTRTKSSINRRIHTRFVLFAVLSCHARVGHIDGVRVGLDGAKGVVS